MTPTEEFITLVTVMSEAQKDADENPTRGNMNEKQKRELRVDAWIQKYVAEKVQLELWTRSIEADGKLMPTPSFDTWVKDDGAIQTGETAGVYNVGDEIKDENAGAT